MVVSRYVRLTVNNQTLFQSPSMLTKPDCDGSSSMRRIAYHVSVTLFLQNNPIRYAAATSVMSVLCLGVTLYYRPSTCYNLSSTTRCHICQSGAPNQVTCRYASRGTKIIGRKATQYDICIRVITGGSAHRQILIVTAILLSLL